MIVKLVLALLGGTVLSLIFGYFIAYWRDIGRLTPKSFADSNWSSFFESLTRLKAQRFKYSERQHKQQSRTQHTSGKSHYQRRSRAPGSWGKHSQLEDLLLKLEDFHPELHSFFLNLKDNSDELFKTQALKLEKQLGIRVSANMMADRMQELLELDAFAPLSLQDAGSHEVKQLWAAHCVAQIYLDDARLGSATLSEFLAHDLKLAHSAVFRGIEAQFMLVKGASKQTLFARYWKEQQKLSFHRSNYLQNLTPGQRANLAYNWARRQEGFEKMRDQLKQTLLEIESSFESFYREHNSQQKNKKNQQRKRSQKRTYQKTSVDKNSLDWAYDLLEMSPTDDFTTIKKQFKKMAMKYHPDRMTQDGLNEFECKKHHEHFVEIQKAYKVLEKKYASKAA